MELPVIVSDIRQGVNSSDPRDMTWVGNKVFFTAGVDGSADQNRELWITDGTEAGTEMVRDIYLGENASNPGWLTSLGSKVYFVASDGIHGNELWVSDGTSSGTKMLGDIQVGSDGSEPKSLFAYGEKLYFSAEKNQDRELWRYDPLHDSLELFYNINNPLVRRLNSQLVDRESGYPQDFAQINDELWFTADDGEHGRELWKTDGTKEGTGMVVDLTKKSSNSAISNLVEMAGYAFFVASSDDARREIFRSDGTTEGTVLLKDIAIGASSNPEDLTVCNGRLFFSADASHLRTGRELYVSDGTISGTKILKDINPNGTSLINHITKVGESVFFVATAGESGGRTGVELWRTDGTSEGTVLVKDIDPGPDSSLPQDMIDANGMLYFKADDGTHGFELWKSDGTELGTVMVADLYEDEADGEPEGLMVANVGPSSGFQVASPSLFFAGYQRENGITTGNELWKLSLPHGDVLSPDLPSVEGPGAGFAIDAGKPVISLPAGTETSAGNWRIYVDEGVADVAPVVADEVVSWDLVTGGDAQKFVLDPLTGELSFAFAPDFDEPSDLDADNIYNFDVQAEDMAGNASVASLEVRVSPVSEGGVMLLSKGGKKPLKTTSGPDVLILKKRNLFGSKRSTRVLHFDCDGGDRLVLKGGMKKRLPSLKDATFVKVSSKSSLKKATRREVDFIYFEPKGKLYYNENSEQKGYGSGGLMMVFKGDRPDFDINCMSDLV